ncbi:MAG: hypothetical protein PHI59_08555 [Candidatus Omnitrophica bacterium]|nr:hypothetical protein [Candidatus Omnitrophota bacterium]
MNKIIVQTRKGNDVDNSQNMEISSYETNLLRELENSVERKFGGERRNNASTVYNCHGLTFASRRTGIYDIQEIHKILKEDDYDEILESDVMPGDIVVYFSENGDIEHSGIVISKGEPPLNIPKIVSKWGHAGFEVIHYVNRSPYSAIKISYYRINK